MASASSSSVKEVDYYLNPTELFRWINYRRWDGAKSRAQSHPRRVRRRRWGVTDEGDVPSAVASRQMEQLMDVLLDCYPEGASSPDDQGMLPLHLLLSKAEGEPNEHVINLLLSSFPNAVDIRDKFGRTPYDILRESCGVGGDQGQAASASDRCRGAFRALKRARYVSDRITSTIRDESANIVAGIQHEASNERGASQKIIVRLEEELNKTRQEMDARDTRERNVQQEMHRLKNELAAMDGKLKEARTDLTVTRKERDELSSQIDGMKARVEGHDDNVEQVRTEALEAREEDIETISKLRSEICTSKAMTEALESQLRSRFTNEEYLTDAVSALEDQLEELKVRNDHATKKHGHELEALAADNKMLKFNADELTKKNAQLNDKLKDMNKQLSQVISSYSALNSENDRLLDVAQSYEASLLESVHAERARLVEHFQKQRKTLESTFEEQERIIGESLQAQDKLLSDAKAERSRGRNTVEKLRNEFQFLRAAAAERDRMTHAEDIAASRKATRHPRKSDSDSIASSSRGESRDPHPSQSHHRIQASSSSTTEGHYMRRLGERDRAQSVPPRDPGVSYSTSATESSAPLGHYGQYRRQTPPRKMPLPMVPSSVSTNPYTSRGGGGDEYSLDQYSECSYSYEEPRRKSMDPPPTPPQHQWRKNRYGNGSYGDESTNE
ncbi:hypothetical protein ACHAXT_010405 [Thalassiosira profunda]